MNKNFYEFARKLIDEISVDDLERQLKDFGFDCQQKASVSLFWGYDFAPEMKKIVVQGEDDSWLPAMDAALTFAANDNCYALAA